MALTMQQKLDFVHKQTKLALAHVQHFDAGGTVINTPQPTGASVGGSNQVGSVASLPQAGLSGLTNPIGSAGGTTQGIANAFTTQNPYQANLAPTTELNYAAPAGTAVGNINAGYGQTQSIIGQQEGLVGEQANLAKTLSAEAAGEGPNPAQAALNENTGRNIEQTAALAAGTRGAGANAGLIAENAARTGAAIQQNAIGQAATLEAQQRLNAQSQLQAQQEAETAAVQGIQSTVQGEQGIQGNLYGASANANNAQNNTSVANYGMAQGINAQVAQNNANAVNKTTGNLLGGIGAAAALFAKGGKVHPHMEKMGKIYHPHLFASGGQVDFGVPSPYSAPPANVQLPKSEDDSGKSASSGNLGGIVSSLMEKGGKVPGKPKVNHDAYKNDIVDAKLSPGEVVIDLDTLKDKGKLGQMARFVANNIERKKAGRKL